MPGGIPVGALAVGKAGAINAGLLAAAILALNDPALAAPGRDAVNSEDKIQAGGRLVTKLWNVAAFSARFID